MDVTFRESEPYYTKPCDLDPLLGEFSSVTEGDCREGENEGANAQREVIVGTIPCSMGRPKTQAVIHQDNVNNGDCDCEGEEIVGDEVVGDGNEEIIDEVSEEVNVEIQKEPIVYQRTTCSLWF